MANGEVEAEDGTVAPAHHVGLGDVQRVKQCDDVVGHEIVAVRAGVARAAAVAAAIHDDDSAARSESLDLTAPIVRVGEAAVQQDDRRTVADRGVIEADAVDFGVAGVLAGNWDGSRRQRLPQRLAMSSMEREKQQEGQQGVAHGWLRFVYSRRTMGRYSDALHSSLSQPRQP